MKHAGYSLYFSWDCWSGKDSQTSFPFVPLNSEFHFITIGWPKLAAGLLLTMAFAVYRFTKFMIFV
jgi:hypothetical protein